MAKKLVFSLAFGAMFLMIALSGCMDTATNPISTTTTLPNGVVHVLGDSTGDTIAVNLGDTIIFTVGVVGPGSLESVVVSSAAVHFDKMLPVLQTPGGSSGKYQFIAYNRGTATISISHTVKGVVFTLTVVVS